MEKHWKSDEFCLRENVGTLLKPNEITNSWNCQKNSHRGIGQIASKIHRSVYKYLNTIQTAYWK